MTKEPRITRIDFSVIRAGVIVNKFPENWYSDRAGPVSHEIKPPDFDLEAAIRWLQEHGWSVRRWSDGARAWRGPMLPVRDSVAIQRLRNKLTEESHLYQGHHPRGLQVHTLELAFDL